MSSPSSIMKKTCTVCGNPQPFPEGFFKDNRLKSGYRARCKSCDMKINTAYVSTHGKQPLTPEQRERYNARRRGTQTGTRSARKVETDRQYRKTEAGKLSHKRLKDRRRALIGEGDLSTAEWNAILERFSGRCAYCGCSEDLTVDHFVPLSKGGKIGAGNIVPACARCNSKKQDTMPDKWCPALLYLAITAKIHG
jgi:5-methylcytosine-specific restriction endonuclease McrA